MKTFLQLIFYFQLIFCAPAIGGCTPCYRSLSINHEVQSIFFFSENENTLDFFPSEKSYTIILLIKSEIEDSISSLTKKLYLNLSKILFCEEKSTEDEVKERAKTFFYSVNFKDRILAIVKKIKSEEDHVDIEFVYDILIDFMYENFFKKEIEQLLILGKEVMYKNIPKPPICSNPPIHIVLSNSITEIIYTLLLLKFNGDMVKIVEAMGIESKYFNKKTGFHLANNEKEKDILMLKKLSKNILKSEHSFNIIQFTFFFDFPNVHKQLNSLTSEDIELKKEEFKEHFIKTILRFFKKNENTCIVTLGLDYYSIIEIKLLYETLFTQKRYEDVLFEFKSSYSKELNSSDKSFINFLFKNNKQKVALSKIKSVIYIFEGLLEKILVNLYMKHIFKKEKELDYSEINEEMLISLEKHFKFLTDLGSSGKFNHNVVFLERKIIDIERIKVIYEKKAFFNNSFNYSVFNVSLYKTNDEIRYISTNHEILMVIKKTICKFLVGKIGLYLKIKIVEVKSFSPEDIECELASILNVFRRW